MGTHRLGVTPSSYHRSMATTTEWRFTLTTEEPDDFGVDAGTDLAQAILDSVQAACEAAGVGFLGLGWIVGGPGGRSFPSGLS